MSWIRLIMPRGTPWLSKIFRTCLKRILSNAFSISIKQKKMCLLNWIMFTNAENPIEVDFESEAIVLWGRHWCVLCDNDPNHSPMIVKHFLVNHCMMEISHQPFSSDLMLAYFLHFLQWKWSPREIFQNMKDIKNITTELYTIPLYAFDDFCTSVERCKLSSSQGRLFWREIKAFILFHVYLFL